MYINKDDLIFSMNQVVQILAEAGQAFNKGLVEQFWGYWAKSATVDETRRSFINKEHLMLYQAVAQTLSWFQGSKDKDKDKLVPVYFHILAEARNKKSKYTQEKLLGALNQYKLRRFYGVVAGLATWTNVKLPDTNGEDILDIATVQQLAIGGGRNIRWTTLAPLKMYALARHKNSNESQAVYPPIGNAVSRGIETIFGIKLGESARDYELSRNLHLKLASYSMASIWDINSGLYLLGEKHKKGK